MPSKTVKFITNEQTKLRATFWNNLAVATVAAGIFIPFLTVSRDPAVFYAGVNFANAWPSIAVAIFAFICGGAMRAIANLKLTNLRDD